MAEYNPGLHYIAVSHITGRKYEWRCHYMPDEIDKHHPIEGHIVIYERNSNIGHSRRAIFTDYHDQILSNAELFTIQVFPD